MFSEQSDYICRNGSIGENKKMEKTIVTSFKVRGTEKEIEKVKARIASLTACEEVISMYIKETKV